MTAADIILTVISGVALILALIVVIILLLLVIRMFKDL